MTGKNLLSIKSYTRLCVYVRISVWLGLAAKIDRVTITNSITQSDRSQVCEYSLQTKGPIDFGWSHLRRYNRFDSDDDDDDGEIWQNQFGYWLHKCLTDCLDFPCFREHRTHTNARSNAKSLFYSNVECARKIFHLQRADLNIMQAFN